MKLRHFGLIFKEQLSILLRLTEFVRDRELSKLSNKAITEKLPAFIKDHRTSFKEGTPNLPYSLPYCL